MARRRPSSPASKRPLPLGSVQAYRFDQTGGLGLNSDTPGEFRNSPQFPFRTVRPSPVTS